jgi:hypothetical protein
MTAISLILFTRQTTLDERGRILATHVNNLVGLEPTFGLLQYKQFHVAWECLQRFLFAGEARSVFSIYKQAVPKGSPEFILSN